MVQYVIKVITALGIVNGAVHNEVKYNGETEVTPLPPLTLNPTPTLGLTSLTRPSPPLTLTLTLAGPDPDH